MSIAERLNRLDEASLQEALTNCCAARRWVERMTAARPFRDDGDLLVKAAELWQQLERSDWLEAFAAHPKIGDLESLRAKYAQTRDWAGSEQSGVAGAGDDVLQRLAQLNRQYEERFGYIFIVCATGKSAAEMLAILAERLPNDAEAELPVAAAEQLKITLLRLEKLGQLP